MQAVSTSATENYIVNTKQLNIRSGPGTKYPVVGNLYYQDNVLTSRIKSGWIEVVDKENGETVGYVRKSFLTKEITPSDQTQDESDNNNVTSAILMLILIATVIKVFKIKIPIFLGSLSSSQEDSYKPIPKPKFYCEYCGHDYSSVRSLTLNRCFKHPQGQMKGFHKLYEGNEKNQYFCKYCGDNYKSLRQLTSNRCFRHPEGQNKGYHAPSL